MKEEILISTVGATFNRAAFLEEVLPSVLQQKVENMELIVVDDGSQDNTEESLSRFSSVIYFSLPENRGVSFARNYGVRKTSGRYI